jgi:hypothetical protein
MKAFKVFILVFVLVMVTITLGQARGIYKIEQIRKVPARKLIVMLDDGAPSSNATDSILGYSYSNALKELVKRFWKCPNKGIEYKSFREVAELRKTGTKEYAILYREEGAGYGLYTPLFGKDKTPQHHYQFNLSFIEEAKGFFPMQLAEGNSPSKTELAFGIDALSLTLTASLEADKTGDKDPLNNLSYTDISKLPQKTLLLRKDMLNKNMTKEDIAAVYPYKFEIVSKEELDEKMMSGNPEYAWLITSEVVVISYSSAGGGGSTMSGAFLFYIFNNENGNFISSYRADKTQPVTSKVLKKLMKH